MRNPLRACLAAALLLIPTLAPAQNLTPRDLLALSKAGLSDDVLIALIDTNKTVFELGPYDVIDLRQRGLSEVVLVRLIRTAAAAMVPPAVPAPPPPPLPVAATPLGIFRRDPDTEPSPSRHRATDAPRVVVQAAPVEVTQTVRQEVTIEAPREVHVPVYVPVVVPTRAVEPAKAPEPEYWGFGGKRRPDAWQDAKPEPVKKTGGGGGWR
jgi:hypothetical protein